METSLIFKTLLILTSQLSLTFGLTYGFIRACRHAHQAGQRFLGMAFDVQENTDGEIDLIPRNLQRRLITLSVYIWLFIAILMVLFARDSVEAGLALMTVSSAVMGPLLGLIMIQADENDGLRLLKLTIVTTIGLGIFGMNVGIDASGLRNILFVGLILIIVWYLLDIILNFSSKHRQFGAMCGVVLFVVYLFYDFNRLAHLDDTAVNDWSTALRMAIHIYLDVLNLILEILGASSDDL